MNLVHFKEKIKFKSAGYLGYNFLNVIYKTLRIKAVNEEIINEYEKEKKGLILVIWHGRMYLPVYYLRNRGIWGIVSPSRDGEYFAQVFSRFGHNIIRGSSRKGSIRAMFSVIKLLKGGNIVAVTPDGPIGPKGKVDNGLIYLAATAKADIVPIGVGYNWKKKLNTWDEALLPYPLSSAVILFDEHLRIPPEINISDIPRYAKELEEMMFKANKKADEIVMQKN